MVTFTRHLVQRAVHKRPLYSLDRLLDGDRLYCEVSGRRAYHGRRVASDKTLGFRKNGELSELAGRNAHALQGFPTHVRLEVLHTR